MERTERIKELDSIRGLAAMIIVFYHLWLQSLGFLGSAVDLFFVLSGYLITTIILTNTLSDRFLISFYIRRGLRIWPIYYLTMLAIVLIYPFLPSCGTLDDLPYYLTFTQEIPKYKKTLVPTFPSAFRHTWSLAIEEQFYLIWPPLLWWIGRRRLKIASLSIVALALVARSLDLSAFILVTHCDGLALGGLLAGMLAAQDRPAEDERRLGFRLGVLGLGSMTLSLATLMLPRVLNTSWPGLAPDVLVYTVKPLFFNLMFFGLIGTIVLHAGDPRLRFLRDRRLVYLGSISYGLYLYHHFIFEFVRYYEDYFGLNNRMILDFVKLVASIAIASLSWKYIERPILGQKNRFGYQPVITGARAACAAIDDVRGVHAS
jgi:peptidoglycan/LPS O-acetylase OafA/YrhL